MVTAIGIKNGKRLVAKLIARDGRQSFTFDGKSNLSMQIEVEEALKENRTILGTYHPKCYALKVAALFGTREFFDGGVESVEVEDQEAEAELADLEHEEDGVY